MSDYGWRRQCGKFGLVVQHHEDIDGHERFTNAQDFQATCLDNEEFDYPFVDTQHFHIQYQSTVFCSLLTKDDPNSPLAEYPETEDERLKSTWSFILE